MQFPKHTNQYTPKAKWPLDHSLSYHWQWIHFHQMQLVRQAAQISSAVETFSSWLMPSFFSSSPRLSSGELVLLIAFCMMPAEIWKIEPHANTVVWVSNWGGNQDLTNINLHFMKMITLFHLFVFYMLFFFFSFFTCNHSAS